MADFADTYRGLYEFDGAPGLLTVTFGRSNMVTATLRTAARSYRLRGWVSPSGYVSLVPMGPLNAPGPRIELVLHGRQSAPAISVRPPYPTSGSSEPQIVPATTPRPARDATVSTQPLLHPAGEFSEPPAATGVYTMTLPRLTAPAAVQGLSWASVRVRPSGVVVMKGRVADGTPFAASGRLSADAKAAMLSRLYRGKGALGAEFAFSAGAEKTATADVRWVRPARAGSPTDAPVDQLATVTASEFRAEVLAQLSRGVRYTRAGVGTVLPRTVSTPRFAVFSDGPNGLLLSADGYFFGHERGRSVLYRGVWLGSPALGVGTVVSSGAGGIEIRRVP